MVEHVITKRTSALHEHYVRGRIGDSVDDKPDIRMHEVGDLTLHQICAWHDTVEQVAQHAATAANVASAPAPSMAIASEHNTALLRIEPLKWWLFGAQVAPLDPQHGSTLDLSHSRTHLRISGEHATTLLNRHLPLDLRATSFPPGAVASSALHHVGITLWHSTHGYDLFIPRGFALSIWEVLQQTATQFNAEVV